MSARSHHRTTNEPSSGTAERLHSDLDKARAQVELLEPAYAELLADPEVIQEDRDATRVLLEHARANLETARRAVERFDAGTYGTCVRCGGPIGDERLAALPEVETCVACPTGRP